MREKKSQVGGRIADPMKGDCRAFILVPLIVLTVMGLLLSLGYVIAVLLGIPLVLGLCLPVRLLGVLLLGIAFGLFLDTNSEKSDESSCSEYRKFYKRC